MKTTQIHYPSLRKHSATKLYPYLKIFGTFIGEDIKTVKGWTNIVREAEFQLN